MRLRTLGLIATLAVGILLAPLAADAQQPVKVSRIGAVHSAWAPNHPAVEGLKAGLKEIGLEEGRDVAFDIRFTEGNLQALPAAAAALVRMGVDVIFTTNEHVTHAARNATRKIPIVFSTVGDPVASRLVNDIPRPGGNVTGVYTLSTELAPKRLEILKTLVPTLRRAWVIYDADDLAGLATARKAQEAVPLLKVELIARPVRTPEELREALTGFRSGDGFVVHDVATTLDIPAQILQRSLSMQVPAIFPAAFWTRYGALASYGADYYATGRQAARLVAKLLRGAQPQNLPVEGANKLELVINLKTAKALGLTIPQSILIRADEVIR